MSNKLESSGEVITLPALANDLYDEFDVLTPGDWLGRGKMTDLLKDASIPDLIIDYNPPGYAYLKGVPFPPSKSVTGEQAKQKDISPEIPEIVQQAHDVTGLPLLTPIQFRFILEKISHEIKDSEFDLTIVSKAVLDESTRLEKTIGRRAISFVLKALLISGHRFEPDLPQAPGVLAEAFFKSVVEGLEKKGFDFKTGEKAALRAHLSGGLLDGTASNYGSADSGSSLGDILGAALKAPEDIPNKGARARRTNKYKS